MELGVFQWWILPEAVCIDYGCIGADVWSVRTRRHSRFARLQKHRQSLILQLRLLSAQERLRILFTAPQHRRTCNIVQTRLHTLAS